MRILHYQSFGDVITDLPQQTLCFFAVLLNKIHSMQLCGFGIAYVDPYYIYGRDGVEVRNITVNIVIGVDFPK